MKGPRKLTIRKRRSPECKATVALEAIRERRTVNELAGEMAICPVPRFSPDSYGLRLRVAEEQIDGIV